MGMSLGLAMSLEHAMPGMADWAVRGFVVLALAGTVAATMRRASAAARHGVWMLGFTGMLLVPIVAEVLPAWRVLPRVSASAPQEQAGQIYIVTPPADQEALPPLMVETDLGADGAAPILQSSGVGIKPAATSTLAMASDSVQPARPAIAETPPPPATPNIAAKPWVAPHAAPWRFPRPAPFRGQSGWRQRGSPASSSCRAKLLWDI